MLFAAIARDLGRIRLVYPRRRELQIGEGRAGMMQGSVGRVRVRVCRSGPDTRCAMDGHKAEQSRGLL
jgi:hypothetical protein